MAVDKNFVVRHGLEVSTDLIYAESVEGKVGIGTTTLEAKLTVQGDLRVEDLEVSGITTSRDLISTNLNVTGVSTFNDIEVNGVTGLSTVSVSSSITAQTYFGATASPASGFAHMNSITVLAFSSTLLWLIYPTSTT